MNYKYQNKANEVLIEKNIKNPYDFMNYMVEMFYEETISDADKKLLALAFKKDISQANLDKFIKDWDIEVYGGAKSLMLAYIMKENPHLKFSEYEKPRLSGLLNFYRFANLKIIAHFTKYTKILNANGVIPLLIKGGAMKHLRPEFPRAMGDTDIVTVGKDFETAKKVAEELGYGVEIDPNFHSIDLHPAGEENGAIDVHRFLDFETKYDKNFINELFKRGKQVKAFGADAIIPCAEDMVFIALTNLAKNLHRKTSMHGILFNLFDCRFLINSKQDFDWNIILKNTQKTNTEVPIFFAMQFLNKLVPGILPEELFKNKNLEKNIKKYCNDVIYFRFHFHDFRMVAKKLKFKKALTDFNEFKQYIKYKPKNFIMKRLRKSSTLVALYLKLFNK